MSVDISELKLLVDNLSEAISIHDSINTNLLFEEDGSISKNLKSLIDFVDGKSDNNSDVETHEQNNDKIKLELVYEGKLLLRNKLNNYYVLGLLSQDLSALPITLIVENRFTKIKERIKLDLYERETVRAISINIAEIFHQNCEEVETEFLQLTDELEKFRENQIIRNPTFNNFHRNFQLIPPDVENSIISFLKDPNLIVNIDKLIEKAGVVGEINARRLLFINASTYKMPGTLHTLIQGADGCGKSHLINIIGQCLPQEDVLILTRVSRKSFYHYEQNELVDKFIIIKDSDVLDDEAKFALNELQQSGVIRTSTIYKDKNGNLKSVVKIVKSRFASLLSTKQTEINYNETSHYFIIGVDESEEQTNKIIEYQNNLMSGLIDKEESWRAKLFLQNCIRKLKAYEVINPYANVIKIPVEVKMRRQLNLYYQLFVKQITILHQYQRKKDAQGRLITEPMDLKIASEILFDVIMLKIDDLDASLRHFFDNLKLYVKKKSKGKTSDYLFTQREIRQSLNVSKTSCFRFIESLEKLDYIQKKGGYTNKGFKYSIIYFDDMIKIRKKIKDELNKQLESLNFKDEASVPTVLEHYNIINTGERSPVFQ